MHRPAPRLRLRRSIVAATVAVAAAAALGGPPAASAASYKSCSPASIKSLQKFTAGFVTVDVKVVSCKTAVGLLRPALTAASKDGSGDPNIKGYRCRLSDSHDTSGGADPFVQYTCSKGARRIRVMLVN